MKSKRWLPAFIPVLWLLTMNSYPQALFEEHIIQEDFQGATCIAGADFNADGDMDFVATANSGHQVSWFENDGTEQFAEHVVITGFTGAKGVIAAKIDANNSYDIVATSKGLGKFSWFSNDGTGSFTEHVITDTSWTSADFVTAEDIDGDRDQDLVLVACDNHKIAWAQNDGNGNFTVILLKENWNKVNWATVNDLDKDGDMDIIASAKAGQIIWFVNNGSQAFTEQVLVEGIAALNSVQAADLDGDGDVDLVASACDATDMVSWFENDGNFNYSQHLLKDHYNGARAVKVADPDQDGDTDLITIAWQAGIVEWWENNGTGSFTSRVITNDAYDMIQVAASDLDQDGDVDLLGACFGDHELRWWENIDSFLIPELSTTSHTGQKPLTVSFTDLTYANPPVTSWQWDLDGDGMIDSEVQNPSFTYAASGYYDVKLYLTSSTHSDSVILPSFIRVFEGESALEFNGSDNRAKCLNEPKINLTGNFTLEAWVKPTGFGISETGKIVDKVLISLFINEYSASVPTDSSFAVMMSLENGSLCNMSTPAGSVKLNAWQHVAFTYDSLTGEAHIYLDGIDQSLSYTAEPSGPVGSNMNREIVIGNARIGNFGFEGCIDEVRVWDTLRSAQEIAEWKDKNLPQPYSNLIAYFPMNEGVGDTLHDVSGNPYHSPEFIAKWATGVDLVSIGLTENPGVQNHELIVFPNPATTNVTVFPVSGKGVLLLLDSNGRKMITIPVESTEKITLNLTEYPAGTYYVVHRDKNQCYSKQLILFDLNN